MPDDSAKKKKITKDLKAGQIWLVESIVHGMLSIRKFERDLEHIDAIRRRVKLYREIRDTFGIGLGKD